MTTINNVKKLTQKNVLKLKRRQTNIGEYRNNKSYIIIKAKQNKRLTTELLNSIKLDLINPKGLLKGRLTKDFQIKIHLIPNRTLTSKGILVRQGSGKGKFKTNALYLLKDKKCIVLTPKGSFNTNVIKKLLNMFIYKYTFFTFQFLI